MDQTEEISLVPGKAKTFKDEDGSAVTVQLTGPGAGFFTLLNGHTTGAPIETILLQGTTDRTSLRIASKGGHDIGTSFSTLEVYDSEGYYGTLGSFSAPGVKLTEGIYGSTMKSIVVGDVDAATGITLDSLGTFKAEVINNLWLQVNGNIRTITAKQWEQGDLQATSLGSLQITGDRRRSIAGDFGATLTLSGEGVQPGKPTLTTMLVAGELMGTTEIVGDAGNISVHSVASDLSISGDARSVKIAGELLGTTTIGGDAGVIAVHAVRGQLSINGDAKSVTVNTPMSIVPPPAGNMGSVHVDGKASVRTSSETIKFTNADLYTATPAMYPLEDLLGYTTLGASWNYSTVYSGSGGSGSANLGVSFDPSSGTATNSLVNASVSTTWQTDEHGTSLLSWGFALDWRNITCEFGPVVIAPPYMRLAQTTKHSAAATGTWDATLTDPYGDWQSYSGDITGTVTVSSRLVGHEQVAVPRGTFLAAKVQLSLAISGRLQMDVEGRTYTGRYSVNQTQTIWAVPGVGAIKIVSTMSETYGIAGVGARDTTRATQQLT